MATTWSSPRRLLVLLALALAPSLALGTTTWSSVATRSAKAVCTTGSESAPSSTTAPTEGIILDRVGVVQVVLEADSGQTLSGAGTLLAYSWDVKIGAWSRQPDLDLAVSVVTLRRQAWTVTVQGDRGRLAFVPSGVTISSGGVTVYHLAAEARDPKTGAAL